LLRDHIKRVIAEQPKKKKKRKGKGKKHKTFHCKKKKKGAINGIISLPLRLSAALRYFAGGDPYNIMVLHGMLHTEVYNSICIMVDAINRCQELVFFLSERPWKAKRNCQGVCSKEPSWF
jgi:hypothetical protein